MAILNASSTGTVSYIINAQVVEEMTLQRGGISAESAASGFAANAVAKEGANTFKFSVPGLYTNENLQSNNLTDALRARGLTTVDSVEGIWNTGTGIESKVGFGGERIVGNIYGAQWRFPVTSLATGAGVLDGRLVEFSGQLTF